jgi:hypothetical protein
LHCDPHLVKPATQLNEQMPLVHVGTAFDGAVHGLPQAPQFSASEFLSVSQPSAAVQSSHPI